MAKNGKYGLAVAMALVLMCAWGGNAVAADIEKMIAERTAAVWIEGQVLGDMVIGARGQLEFTLADAKLVKAVFDDVRAAPEWIVFNLQHAGKKETRGKVLFVVRFKALIPWTFDPEKLVVGDYRVRSTDIFTDKAYVVQGELPSGTTGEIALAVPESAVGKETPVGYDAYTTILKKTWR